ncbi:hypothetical protein IFM89_031785 [Coptis chinensis]|uniref:Protein kinase domain-containing protein n=1 Tax=Coptis chinensis TaxID=261450 RepID=A0A835ME19_9MAGN|nr:hypothetical protein IFM89_031785 [Coptis chinensis]
MELCSGGDLFEKVVKKGVVFESKSALILKELILVIKHCHKNGVVLIETLSSRTSRHYIGKLKLADFGLATWWIPTGNRLSSLVGSRSYVAPKFFWEIIPRRWISGGWCPPRIIS